MLIPFRKFSIVVVTLLGITLAGCEKGFLEKHSEEKIAISQVPAPVKTTIEQQSAGGSVKQIEKQTKDGKTFYAASIVLNGNNEKLLVGEDGKLINKRAGDDDDDD